MNKAELVRAVSNELNVVQGRCTDLVECVLKHISEGLKSDGEVKLMPDLGVLSIVKGNPWSTTDPRTGETVHYPPKKRVSFRPARRLRMLVWPKAAAEPEEVTAE